MVLLRITLLLILYLFSIFLVQCQTDCTCSDDYAPVCGMDSLIYWNECEANCANVAFTNGICPLVEKGTILFLGDANQNECGWLIQLDNDSSPNNYLLPSTDLFQDYQEDSLRVEITYRPNDVIYECAYVGVIYSVIKDVEVLNIRRL